MSVINREQMLIFSNKHYEMNRCTACLVLVLVVILTVNAVQSARGNGRQRPQLFGRHGVRPGMNGLVFGKRNSESQEMQQDCWSSLNLCLKVILNNGDMEEV
ncbi:hypothetical protein LOTGIDRAFT_175046 [Lottia gigantea]|uniref:Uncharacterized protein n=1 Tax=Lottia gigantea TaxID=225164 RepID=V4C335_LOTGI|nr:hypothetical protein LOTGIDRAFT_175046 [Lottia gigantea]ESO95909.1 hypothetical protein LOTGIDRAFT_175046 [Lottia gigantea]